MNQSNLLKKKLDAAGEGRVKWGNFLNFNNHHYLIHYRQL